MFEIFIYFFGLYFCVLCMGRICKEGGWDDVD